MEATGYVAVSHLTALRRRMDMIANNMANMSTTGYKAEKPLFTSVLRESTRGDKVAYVEDFGSIRDLSMGTMQPTSNPLDLAINGEGYFQVETPDGIKYTRNGMLMLNNSGEITTHDGYPMLDDSGNAIVIPTNTKNITVSNDGTITADGSQIARIQPVMFEKERELQKLPNGLYETEEKPAPLEKFEIRQGMIEGSNVVPILEMTQMMEVSRRYESANKLLKGEDERQRDAIRTLSGNN